MGAIAMIEKPIIEEADKQLKLASKLHAQAYDTGSPALEKAYRRAMLRYMAKVIALEQESPEYVKTLREAAIESMLFLEGKLDSLMRLEKTANWNDKLHAQFEKTLVEYEVVHDQSVALGWEQPQVVLHEARHPCYKASGLCRIAENQSLSACVYNPDVCRGRVNK
jgi:hypothetical protein